MQKVAARDRKSPLFFLFSNGLWKQQLGYAICSSIQKSRGILAKGQVKPKADWCAINSPKKWTNEFVLFAFLLFTANKTNLFVQKCSKSMCTKSTLGNSRVPNIQQCCIRKWKKNPTYADYGQRLRRINGVIWN